MLFIFSQYSIKCQKVLNYSSVCGFFVAGAEGKVDESMELMKEVEDLKQKKRIAEVGKGMAICFILVQCNIALKRPFPLHNQT